MALNKAYGGTNVAIPVTPFLEGLQAVSGILEATTEAVDHVVFGPAMDPVKDWHTQLGAAVVTPLMLAVLKDTGVDSEIDIWDLTDNTVLDAGSTPLVTVIITGASSPTSIKAAMGYIIAGHEDGVIIIDPHDGAWAERTEGWPKSLSILTTPALTNNDVQDVCAGFSDRPRFDPRTGGPMPTFALKYGAGVDDSSLIKDNGDVFEHAGNALNKGCTIYNGHLFLQEDGTTGDNRGIVSSDKISAIQADDWSNNVYTDNDGASPTAPFSFGIENAFDKKSILGVGATAEGVSFIHGNAAESEINMAASVNRTYNTGWLACDIRGAWLANSKIADRSYKANTLTENGTVTEAVVETGAELLGYSGFSTNDYLRRADDADYNSFGTGTVALMGWIQSSGNAAIEHLFGFGNAENTLRFQVRFDADGKIRAIDRGAGAQITIVTDEAFDDGNPHFIVWIKNGDADDDLWVDGVLKVSNALTTGSLTGAVEFTVGLGGDGLEPATSSIISLVRLTATAPTAAQIRHMYETERRMFEPDAKCLLQSGSTDAVLDVSVDPVTGKVAVLQTDSLVVFDGLTIDREPALPAGAISWEHVMLYGDDLFTITDIGVHIDIAAKDLRHESELLRGEALPKGVDLSKAKVLLHQTGTDPATIGMSMNIKSVTRSALGQYDVEFEVPFKSDVYVALANALGADPRPTNTTLFTATSLRIKIENNAGTDLDSAWTLAIFGELENE